jgi:hypothetical protein
LTTASAGSLLQAGKMQTELAAVSEAIAATQGCPAGAVPGAAGAAGALAPDAAALCDWRATGTQVPAPRTAALLLLLLLTAPPGATGGPRARCS